MLSIVKTVCRNWLPKLKILAVLVCVVAGAEAVDYAEDNDWSNLDNPWLYHQCVMYIQKYDKEPLVVVPFTSNDTTPPTLTALASKVTIESPGEEMAVREELWESGKKSSLVKRSEPSLESSKMANITEEQSSSGKLL